jgi:hypothetical protein
MNTEDDSKQVRAKEYLSRLQQQREQLQVELSKNPVTLRLVTLSLVFGGGVFCLSYYSIDPLWRKNAENCVGLALISSFLMFSIFAILSRQNIREKIRSIDSESTGIMKEELQTTLEEDFFTKLVKINFKYIDQYYLQTQSQANKSFILTAVVAGIAASIIIAGVVLMYFGKTTPAYVTAASGILGEFIAAVFFYFYNRTITKMGQYHQKLVLTQNISLAMKIAEGLPQTERVQAQKELVLRLTENVNKYLIDLPDSTSEKKG